LIFCYAHIDENQAKQIAEILCQVLQEIWQNKCHILIKQ
jgi:hypothetical protein